MASKMTPAEISAKVEDVKPAWVKQYIRDLEGLTRELGTRLQSMGASDQPAEAAGPAFPLYESELEVAWRALDAMDNAAFSPEDDAIIKRLRDHFAAQLPPRPDEVAAVPATPSAGLPDGVTLPGDPEGYEVVQVLDGTENMAPLVNLPDRAEIRFSDFYQVHFGAHDTTAGARVLVIETDGPLVIRSIDPGTIIVARG